MLSDLGILVIIIGGPYVYFSDEQVELRRLEKEWKPKRPQRSLKFPTAVESGRWLGRMVRRLKCI